LVLHAGTRHAQQLTASFDAERFPSIPFEDAPLWFVLGSVAIENPAPSVICQFVFSMVGLIVGGFLFTPGRLLCGLIVLKQRRCFLQERCIPCAQLIWIDLMFRRNATKLPLSAPVLALNSAVDFR